LKHRILAKVVKVELGINKTSSFWARLFLLSRITYMIKLGLGTFTWVLSEMGVI
jgi:hypothetical protein